ncbi:hypothetical protein [Streptomyces sp. Tu 6176]|uniref:hypothetical protein n=1 Tax=Streptomyces sp. Tu 6176 TaxID=1470557 RepID=UPI0007C5C1AA|nr:hypothetical protein [Streptomyces sp. Tu 6176]
MTAVTFRSYAAGTYWSVPMASPAELCAPLTVARLIAAGVHRMAGAEIAAVGQADEPPARDGA